MSWLADKAYETATGRPAQSQAVRERVRQAGPFNVPSLGELPKVGEAAVHALEAATGKLYEPQTTAGEYAARSRNSCPGRPVPADRAHPPGRLRQRRRATPGARPRRRSRRCRERDCGAGDERHGAGAVGARAAGGLAGGVGMALARRPSARRAGLRCILRQGDARGIRADPAARRRCRGLAGADGTATPIDLTWPEAAQQVLGPRRAGDLMRIVEGQGGLSGTSAGAPTRSRRRACRARPDRPAGAEPTPVGIAARQARRVGMGATPEGQEVARATLAWANG